jgi:uncharacterized protein (TIGR01319 family)
MDLAVAVDFGSTFTKGAAFDVAKGTLLGVAYQPSTVGSDVRIGLRAVLDQLQGSTRQTIAGAPTYVCSSAAGGLRMVVIGLVPSLSLEAAQRAALGAGAKIIGAFGHKLPPAVLQQIESACPDLILLAGGIDGGDEATIQHNARMLADSKVDAPIIVAGNYSVSGECHQVLTSRGKTALLAPNILPEIDRIEIEKVHATIRDLFVRHITRAKGIEQVVEEVPLVGKIIPTPSAVLGACQLLSEGTAGRKGWGDIVIADIGGATTDIHSAATGAPTRPGAIPRGLPELFLKRTVEGDLGMRANAMTIVERAGPAHIAALASSFTPENVTEQQLLSYVERLGANSNHVPSQDAESAVDAALAHAAISIAMQRHAGKLREVFTASGAALLQYGKDLSNVATVIGVGGVLARGRHARFALQGVVGGAADNALCPTNPRFLIDRSYVLYAIGLIANTHPAAAFDLAQELLVEAQ